MAERDETTIKEGFLCPICHNNLRSHNNLVQHFQEQHSEEPDLLKSIKEIYGKTIKKILKLDEQQLESFKNEMKLEKYTLEYSDKQELGQVNSHTDFFKDVRRDRLDHRTTETNKLIIRLDKLLQFYGSDRKQQEQNLVTWLDGTSVTRCPSCAASFNIAKRQHHCRLCGSIMCNNCSVFLPYETAETIIAPVHTNRETPNSSRESDSLRVCRHCLAMLESRRKVQIEQMIQPIICQLYSQIQKTKSQIETSVEMYYKMYNSITSGDTTYLLQDVQALRSDIANMAEMLNTLSKKIQLLPIEEELPKSASLQNSIRKATSMYIKDNLLTLPAPPTLQEIEQYKQELRAKFQDSEAGVVQPKAAMKKVVVTTGWSPAAVVPQDAVEQSDDPLIQQMNIVRNYIAQAKSAGRREEMVCLQENLEMLKKMHREQRLRAGK